MAFLDNSGDIILDAVLTDAGRQRMARGNFKITKFAFGDEEINYKIFNGSHPSGSAFYDLEIMQTPVLEAFTNNTSLMKSKLVTMTRNNILFLPTLKLNNNSDNKTIVDSTTFPGGYILLADIQTETSGSNIRKTSFNDGILRGEDSNITSDNTNHIAVDQGIDSNESGLSFKSPLSDDLVETAFLIRVDHRLMQIKQVNGAGVAAEPTTTARLVNQFVDDDGIASYYVSMGDGTTCVEGKPGSVTQVTDQRGPDGNRGSVINNPDALDLAAIHEAFEGPLGSVLRIYPQTSMHVRQSTALFNEIGTTVTGTDDIEVISGDTDYKIVNYKYIDTLINVVGVTTGYSIDIPVRIVKRTS